MTNTYTTEDFSGTPSVAVEHVISINEPAPANGAPYGDWVVRYVNEHTSCFRYFWSLSAATGWYNKILAS